jgi:hypothetical protein
VAFEKVANRFQYGDGFHSDSLVVGAFADYDIKFREIDFETMEPAQTEDPESQRPEDGVPGIEQIDSTPPDIAEKLERYTITVEWLENRKQNDLGLEAWRLIRNDDDAP